MSETKDTLLTAVQSLTFETRKLHDLLQSEYPKRGEVERKFVSKLQQQRLVIRLLLGIALLTLLTFVGTIGSFSVCLVGDNNPGFCKAVPGYNDRIDRRTEIDNKNARQDRELERLLKRLDLNPLKPGAGGNG